MCFLFYLLVLCILSSLISKTGLNQASSLRDRNVTPPKQAALVDCFIPKKIKKIQFPGNKTVNQRFGANLKKRFFLQNFAANFLLFSFLPLKTLKMTISTSIWGAQHPNAGRNIQQQVSKNIILVFKFHWQIRK